MADTCCSKSKCEELVTIGYMRELAIIGGCCSVSSATPFNSCCSANESAYTPDYSEISGGTYARVRSKDPTNFDDDISGFECLVPTTSSNACATTQLSKKKVAKNELMYEYTVAEKPVLEITKEPSSCNTSGEIQETKSYTRYSAYCGDNGDIVISSETTSFPKTVPFSISKYFYENTNYTWGYDISFGRHTYTSKTKDDCGEYSASTTSDTISGYQVGFNYNGPSDGTEIECDGTSFTITYDTGGCSDDFSIEVSTSNCEASDDEQGTISVTVPKNDEGVDSCSITISASAGDNRYDETYTFNRGKCSYEPSVGEPSGCGPFWPDFEWEQDESKGIYVHPNN